MASGRSRLVAVLVGVSLGAGGCGSSGSAPAPAVSRPPSSSGSGSAVQGYLDAVDRLCEALLPKVVEVTHGGSLDIPVKAYFAQRAEHAKLLADFDRALARVPVPPAAKETAAVFAAYVRFADRLDARRLAAARRGPAAYAKEIKSEASLASDPRITALTSAGFDQSCQAR